MQSLLWPKAPCLFTSDFGVAAYWLRASTINANVPEPFFQTLKRHWDTVVERVAAFIDTLGHRAQP